MLLTHGQYRSHLVQAQKVSDTFAAPPAPAMLTDKVSTAWARGIAQLVAGVLREPKQVVELTETKIDPAAPSTSIGHRHTRGSVVFRESW